MSTTPVSFRWSEDFVAEIDAARGDVPRSAFVRSAVAVFLAKGKTYVQEPGADPRPPANERELRKHMKAKPSPSGTTPVARTWAR